MKIQEVYNIDYFEKIISMNLKNSDVIKKIAKDLFDYENYRIDCWAYAGDILWCRDYYGTYYKIPELIEYCCVRCIEQVQGEEWLKWISNLYLQLLMIHPFENGNGRIIYSFIGYLIYKYHHKYLRILLLKNEDRLHEDFRKCEHQAYANVVAMCESLKSRGIIRYDNRMNVKNNSIGYYNYSSLKIIFEHMYEEKCIVPLERFFINKIQNICVSMIVYLGGDNAD